MVVEVGDVAVSAAHVPMAQAVELRTELGTIPTTASDPSNSATDTGDVAAPPAQVPMAQAVELGAVVRRCETIFLLFLFFFLLPSFHNYYSFFFF